MYLGKRNKKDYVTIFFADVHWSNTDTSVFSFSFNVKMPGVCNLERSLFVTRSLCAAAAGQNRDEDYRPGVSISRGVRTSVAEVGGGEGAQPLQRINEGERVKLELGKPD